jgi:hypothetical protein
MATLLAAVRVDRRAQPGATRHAPFALYLAQYDAGGVR